MSDLNPYAIPDDDINQLLQRSASADGFGALRSHVLDNVNPCHSCGGAIHRIVLSDGIPSEVLDGISQHLDEMPEEVRLSQLQVARSMPERTRTVIEYAAFTKDLGSIASNGPLLRALAEVVNEMSGGRLEMLWQIYQSERELIIEHYVLKATNSMVEILSEKQGTIYQGVDDHILLGVLSQIQEHFLGEIKTSSERYRFKAGESHYEVDEMLISVGIFSLDRNKSGFAAHTMVDAITDEIGIVDINP